MSTYRSVRSAYQRLREKRRTKQQRKRTKHLPSITMANLRSFINKTHLIEAHLKDSTFNSKAIDPDQHFHIINCNRSEQTKISKLQR